MGNALATRSESQTLFKAGIFTNKAMLGAVLLTFFLQLGVIYLPFLQGIFKTSALSILELIICIASGVIVLFVIDRVKLLRYRKN